MVISQHNECSVAKPKNNLTIKKFIEIQRQTKEDYLHGIKRFILYINDKL